MVTSDEIKLSEELESELKPLGCVMRDASKSWYKAGPDEIKVWRTSGGHPQTVPLATLSPVVAGLKAVNQKRLYVPIANRDKANGIVNKVAGDKYGK